MTENIIQAIKECVITGEYDQINHLCREALKQGILAYEIIMKGINEGMKVVGEEYESGKRWLPDLILAGEIMEKGMAVLEPELATEKAKSRGVIVAGSVAGDVHDIGKNLVIAMLRGTGFNVVDLGINVAAEIFLESAGEHRANIVAASAYLSTTAPELREVIQLVRNYALESVKVLVGGAAVTQKFARDIGADGWAPDALQAVKVADSLI